MPPCANSAPNGLAGARTDQIAAAAGVNKALLYYYFESKENLYIAALEMIAGEIRDSSMAVFLREPAPGERVLRTALDHFDRILAQREFQSLMQQEMMRLHKGESERHADPGQAGLCAAADHVSVHGARGHRVGRIDRGGLAADPARVAGRQCLLFSQRAGVADGDAVRAVRTASARGAPAGRWWSFWGRRSFRIGSKAPSWPRGSSPIRRCLNCNEIGIMFGRNDERTK